MHFGNPTALWSLLLVPLAVLIGWMANRRRGRTLERFGDAAMISQLFPEDLHRWRSRRVMIGIIVLTLLSFSAARPQYGRTKQQITRSGVDIFVAIDTSPSMLATDVKPNRLAKAKESLNSLVRGLRGNRIGIIGFAGDAFMLCPLTVDYSLAAMVLESIDETTIGVAGTDLGKAIETAHKAFRRGGAGSPVLVLLTDGEDNEGRGLAAAQEAAEFGVQIFAIGIGSRRGAPVPDDAGGFKNDEDGKKVVSMLDMGGLTAIADATGGMAFEAGDNPMVAVNRIKSYIDRLDKGELESQTVYVYQDRFVWFIAPAILGLLWLLITRPGPQQEVATFVRERMETTSVI